MRKLDDAPRALRESDKTSFGSFRGGLPRMDFGPIERSRLWQLVHKKRWTYAAVSDERVFVGVACVSLGYAATAIAFVLDRKGGRMLADRSLLAPATAIAFHDDGPGQRAARFSFGRTRIEVGDERVVVDLPAEPGGLPVHVAVEREPGGAAEPISAVVPVDGGYANATEKRVQDARGEVVAGGRRFLLDRALVALDHTSGFLARHTVWRWALGLGRAKDGERIALNLVEGFVGEAECGAWLGDVLHPLGEGRFSFDEGQPEAPWKLTTTCGSVDLVFKPAAIHAEHKDMFVVRSKFIQPVGAFEGRITLAGRDLEVTDLAGVTEHQDVLW